MPGRVEWAAWNNGGLTPAHANGNDMLLLTSTRLTSITTGVALGILLGALPVRADAPTGAAQTLILQHVVPGDVLKLLHWDLPANWPPGVSRIRAQPETNSLSVIATPAGFENVQEVVKLLDFAPHRVKIKFVLARATTADLQASGLHSITMIPTTSEAARSTAPTTYLGMASGGTAVQLLTILARHKAVLQSPTITTTNNVDASISISGASYVSGVQTFRFAATPRVNSDNSITLKLHPSLSRRGSPVTQEIQTLRTFQNGETVVLINVFPLSLGSKNLLLFVTPMVLPDENSPATGKKR